MGAFNILRAEVACGYCGEVQPQEIQFKYGRVYQLEYQLGDALDWRTRGVVGRLWPGNVVTSGIAAGECRACHRYSDNDLERDWLCHIVVTNGYLQAVTLATWPVPYNELQYVEQALPNGAAAET